MVYVWSIGLLAISVAISGAQPITLSGLEWNRAVVSIAATNCGTLWSNHYQETNFGSYFTETDKILSQVIKNTNGITTICSIDLLLSFVSVNTRTYVQLWTTFDHAGVQIGANSVTNIVGATNTVPTWLRFNFPVSPNVTNDFYLHVVSDDLNEANWHFGRDAAGLSYEDMTYAAVLNSGALAVQDDFCFRIYKVP